MLSVEKDAVTLLDDDDDTLSLGPWSCHAACGATRFGGEPSKRCCAAPEEDRERSSSSDGRRLRLMGEGAVDTKLRVSGNSLIFFRFAAVSGITGRSSSLVGSTLTLSTWDISRTASAE